MYGTIARIRVKPGMEPRLLENAREEESERVPGYITQFIYKMDKSPDSYMLVVIFRDRESYFAAADDPKQTEKYYQIVQFLESEPEWNDGEIIFAGSGTSIQ